MQRHVYDEQHGDADGQPEVHVPPTVPAQTPQGQPRAAAVPAVAKGGAR